MGSLLFASTGLAGVHYVYGIGDPASRTALTVQCAEWQKLNANTWRARVPTEVEYDKGPVATLPAGSEAKRLGYDEDDLYWTLEQKCADPP